jgi:hypothetical protein
VYRTAHALSGRSPTMITLRVEKRYGNALVRSRVTATSIEGALELAGEGARVVFPIDGQAFFASAKEDPQANRGPEDSEVVLPARRVIGR